VIVGSGSTADPAFVVGDWPSGVIVHLYVLGRIQGCAGDGGRGASVKDGDPGLPGGRAFFTRFAIKLHNAAGQIFGGGGGGGGGAGAYHLFNGVYDGAGGGGGGGAGQKPGRPGLGGGSTGGLANGYPGGDGTVDHGGNSGLPYPTNYPWTAAGFGGGGGEPGQAGANGAGGFGGASGGIGGAVGNSMDGLSYVTFVGGAGDIRGPQIN
jgi:hypothetical protein